MGEFTFLCQHFSTLPVNPEGEVQTRGGLKEMPGPKEKCQQLAGGGWSGGLGGLPHPSSPLPAHAELKNPWRKAGACLRGFPAIPTPFLGSVLPSPLAGKPEAEGGSSTQLCSPRHFHIMLMHSC